MKRNPRARSGGMNPGTGGTGTSNGAAARLDRGPAG